MPSMPHGGMNSGLNHHKILAEAFLEIIDTWMLTVIIGIIAIIIFLLIVPRKVMWMYYARQVTFEGKHILITGASSGMGEEMCKQVLDLGAKKVIIAARRVDELKRVKEECKDKKGEVDIWELDMSDPNLVLNDATKFARTVERVDILINNAGVSMKKNFVDFDFESCQTMINTNCTSHIALTKAFLPHLRASRGQLVFINGIAGLVGTGMSSLYSCAKFGITGFARSIRPEFKELGVTVSVIYPGNVQTDAIKNAITGVNKTYGKDDEFAEEYMKPADAVKDMLVAIHKGELDYVCSDETWHNWMTLYRNLSWWTEDTESTNDYRR